MAEVKMTQTKFYVAASWEDKEMVKEMVKHFQEQYGWEVTCEWWKHTRSIQFDRLSYSLRDKKAVLGSDILIMYNGDTKSGGKMIEVGMALACGIPVYVFGNKITTVFGELTHYLGEW